MTLIESYLDQLQTEKLDVNELISKSNKTFQRVYKNEVDNCFARQDREHYSNPYADINCEQKSQLIAYKHILKRLDVWIKHCKDIKCNQQGKNIKRRIENKINYLESIVSSK